MAARVSCGTETPRRKKQSQPASAGFVSSPGMAACSTRTAAGMTSCPMPSPSITHRRGISGSFGLGCALGAWIRFPWEAPVLFDIVDNAARRQDFAGELRQLRQVVDPLPGHEAV